MTTVDDARLVPSTSIPSAPAQPLPGPSSADLLPGSAASALVACGVGAVGFGVAIVAAEASKAAKAVLTLGTAAGSLSGKALACTATFLLAWAVLHVVIGRRRVSTRATLWWTGGLILAGLLLTFPPVYQLFAATH